MWSSLGRVRGLVASGSKDSNDRIRDASTVHFYKKKAVLRAAHNHNTINGAAPVHREALRTFGFSGHIAAVTGDGDCWLSLGVAEGLNLGSDQAHWRSRALAILTELTPAINADSMQADLSDLNRILSEPGRPYLPDSFAMVLAMK